jgi:hypothetical protein
LGYAVGAGLGILIPELHKKTNKSGISVAPVMGLNYQGLGMTYHITK